MVLWEEANFPVEVLLKLVQSNCIPILLFHCTTTYSGLAQDTLLLHSYGNGGRQRVKRFLTLAVSKMVGCLSSSVVAVCEYIITTTYLLTYLIQAARRDLSRRSVSRPTVHQFVMYDSPFVVSLWRLERCRRCSWHVSNDVSTN